MACAHSLGQVTSYARIRLPTGSQTERGLDAGSDLEEIALAKAYRRSRTRVVINRIVRAFDSVGLGSRTTYMLTVTGRKSGLPRTTPVTAVQDGDTRWMVAPYGDVAITRPYFDVKPDSPLEDFVAEAPRHPVFLIRPATEPTSAMS
jgi:hypothetical protein